MKTFIAFCVLAFAISVVETTPAQTNAQRFALGLPPLPPRNMGVSRSGARRATTSSTPYQCGVKRNLCCATYLPTSGSITSTLAETLLLTAGVPQSSAGDLIGTGCVSPSLISGTCTIVPGVPVLTLAKCCGTIAVGLVGIDCTRV
ncbi:hypothetical protein DFH08DRAFT_879107 [Mycena albidolilacea]|uniref:Hydrophobin n=1 Tax=Mycena albidolilacea TaxID=1033008 RepID=A0AAD7EL72_9AGAR|nr:hypothetical protein DFH08DRAFT_879107 [Mycena albidolilacea]